VRLLLERGADPNVPEEGNAPHGRALYSAVYIRHVDVARVLLEHGANPNQEVESSADAPSIAIMNSDTKMIELLAEPSGGFPCNSQIHSMGWPSTLSYQQVAATGITRSLVVLASYGDLDTARAVLADDPALADDPEALAAAATNGHEAIVRLLLRHRPRLAGRVAVVARSRELTELLFQNGMNPDLTGWLGVTPRHRFARQGDVDKAAIFLDHGANLHARDEELCTTPLGYAAYAGKLRMVEFLLRRGAKPTLPDDLAWATPIALATYRGHDAVVRVLEAHAS
jgi:ankyrin repeat protein